MNRKDLHTGLIYIYIIQIAYKSGPAVHMADNSFFCVVACRTGIDLLRSRPS